MWWDLKFRRRRTHPRLRVTCLTRPFLRHQQDLRLQRVISLWRRKRKPLNQRTTISRTLLRKNYAPCWWIRRENYLATKVLQTRLRTSRRKSWKTRNFCIIHFSRNSSSCWRYIRSVSYCIRLFCLFICLFDYLFVCLFVCLFICLLISLFFSFICFFFCIYIKLSLHYIIVGLAI